MTDEKDTTITLTDAPAPLAPKAEDTPAPEVQNPDGTTATALESWPAEDVRRILKASEYLVSRQVGLVMGCVKCGEHLGLVGRDAEGSMVVACPCTRRVWRAR